MTDVQLEQLQHAFPPLQRVALDRILLRARVDLDYALVTIGTGAPVTVKRASVIQMALRGETLPAIALATGLSEIRAEQIVENVLSAGVAALYPSFVETVHLPERMTEKTLSNTIFQFITSAPSNHGMKFQIWSPASLVDFLVFEKILADSSISHIQRVIKENIDFGTLFVAFRYTVSNEDVYPRNLPWWPYTGLILGAGIDAVGVALWQGGDARIPITLILLGTLFACLCLANIIQKALDRKLFARLTVKKAVPGPPVIAARAPAVASPVNGLPSPRVILLHALSLPPTPWNVNAINKTSNALGRPPVRVLYLWDYAAQCDQRSFQTQGWPQIGPVCLQLDGSVMTVLQLLEGMWSFSSSDQKGLDFHIENCWNRRVTTVRRGILGIYLDTPRTRPHIGYSIEVLECDDVQWKPTFQHLAARSDLIIVNLSGYNPRHPALAYEIDHLLRGVPPTRFAFLYDRTTDADALIKSVLDAWSRLEIPPGSPVPSTPELIFIRIPDSQPVGHLLQFSRAGFGTKWLAGFSTRREGPYLPIAGRIFNYLDHGPAGKASS